MVRLIGNDEEFVVMPYVRSGHTLRRSAFLSHYYAIDGGSGSHLLSVLAEYSPLMRPANSPRHADILLIIAPVNRKLVPALIEIAEALPRPAHVLLVEDPVALQVSDALDETTFAHLDTLFPNARHLATFSVDDIYDTMISASTWEEMIVTEGNVPDAETIQLPPKQEQEMATELAVLSLGPVQPFTSGPVRVFLVCDGEQVFSVQVESGYAHRGIADAMQHASWQQSLTLARVFDPLAPIASQLAYVNAIEQLQRWEPVPQVASLREAALALERGRNHLWWLVHFMHLLSQEQYLDRSYQLATINEQCLGQLWRQSPADWIVPQYTGSIQVDAAAVTQLTTLTDDVEELCKSMLRNRWLKLRTRGIGILNLAYLREHAVSGPVLQASVHNGSGDVKDRVLARVQNAANDVRHAVTLLAQRPSIAAREINWDIPAGEAHATVEGPRGNIGIHVKSDGGEKPAHVAWQSPSAALLPLLPEILPGHILADAETIIASLDLAMAEADG